MKKYLLLIVAGLMLLSSVGCSKNEETAVEVMEKVQQKYLNAYGVDIKMDADYTVSISGMEIKMDMEIAMKQENMQEPEKLVMESDMEMSMLGQSISMKEWIKDGVIYIDDSMTKSKQSLDTSDLTQMSEKMGMFSQDSLTEFAKNATLEKTENGYVLAGSLDYENALEEFMGNLGLGESMGMDVADVLSSLNVEAFNVSYSLSNDYEIKSGHIDLKAVMIVEGQEMTLDLSMDMAIEAYDEPKIQLPDFSAWDMKSVSCSFESGGISELMIMNALDDDVTEVQSYMVINYAAYGIESDEDKEYFIQNTREMFQAYEGVECSVDDLGDEMGVAVFVDMSKASISTLVELGFARTDSAENQRFSLSKLISGFEAGGYSCN